MDGSFTPDIGHYGVRANTGQVQTLFLQAALDARAAVGGGTLTLSAGLYITGTLHLPSQVTLHLESGARLLGSADLADYPEVASGFVDAVGQMRNRCMILSRGTIGACITGQGCIDGNGGSFPQDLDGRPFLIRFIDCRDVQVTGVTLRDSAGWVSHYLGCENVLIQGITIHSHVNSNNDGIDIDCCRRVRISQCDIDTGDDAICIKATRTTPCENVVVTGCNLRSTWAALKLGTESAGDFRNIIFSDCVIRDTLGGGLKIISMDGCRMENIQAHNLIMDGVCGPIFVRLGARLRRYHPDEPERPVGRICNVSLRDISITVKEEGYLLYGTHARKAGIIVTGVPGHCVEDLSMENLRVSFPGGGTQEMAAHEAVPEMVAEYPEFPMFHPLPAWAFYLRHVRGMRLCNVQLSTAEPDARPAIFCDDVERLTLDGITIAGEPAAAHALARTRGA